MQPHAQSRVSSQLRSVIKALSCWVLRILKDENCTAPLGSLPHHLTISTWRNFSLHPIWTSLISFHFCSLLISCYAQSRRDWLHSSDVGMDRLPKAMLPQAESAQLPQPLLTGQLLQVTAILVALCWACDSLSTTFLYLGPKNGHVAFQLWSKMFWAEVTIPCFPQFIVRASVDAARRLLAMYLCWRTMLSMPSCPPGPRAVLRSCSFSRPGPVWVPAGALPSQAPIEFHSATCCPFHSVAWVPLGGKPVLRPVSPKLLSSANLITPFIISFRWWVERYESCQFSLTTGELTVSMEKKWIKGYNSRETRQVI